MIRVAAVSLLLFLLAWSNAYPRDNGQYANDPLHDWFKHLASKKGLCCSNADGALVKDADWETYRGADGLSHYRVAIAGKLVDVPDDAVVTKPNRYGPAMIWGYLASGYGPALGVSEDSYVIRCFLPGSMT